jgi:8-oxo-dGTP pyrophosphatase MutT (NUDIX family)
MSQPADPPIASAATTIVLREGSAGLQVLLVQRASTLVFHGGAWVFPGGRVDAEDAEDGAGGHVLDAARHAAVRETREETGLITSPAALVPFSHWTTPAGGPRRFATWFFVTPVQAAVEAVVDGGEIHGYRWLAPDEALSAQRRGELDLPPPTFVSLCSLATCRSIGDALALAQSRPPPVFVPRPRSVPDGLVSLYHGDVAYDGGPLDAPGPRHRLCMLKSGYRYEAPDSRET